MEVDLLRPGTVPMAPDTILWFEFLLHQDLLLNHLQKIMPDPTPTELISKFYDAINETLRNRPEIENGEIVLEPIQDYTKHPAKNIALKILSLKIAAFIKWNLGQIRSLSFRTQVQLLQDLLYFTNDKSLSEIPSIDDVDLDAVSPAYLFALLLYHRWILNVTMHRITSNWQIRVINNSEISPGEETVICSIENVKKTIEFLTNLLNWSKLPGLLTFDCFKLPTEGNENIQFDWSSCQAITKEELTAQISYDLGAFFFYKDDYNLARENFARCIDCYHMVKDSNGFMSIDLIRLEAYVRACNGPAEGTKGSLLEQLNLSIINHYMGITTILQQDNIYREIPLAQRFNVELDIQGAVSSGTFTVARDLLGKIRALNMVRCFLDKKPLYQQTITSKNSDTLLWAIEMSWKNFTSDDKKLLKDHLLNLVLKQEIPNLLNSIQANSVLSNIFEPSELQFIKSNNFVTEIPETVNNTDWTFYDFQRKKKHKKLELRQLEQQLINSFNHKEIRELLEKIGTNPLTTNIWGINPLWELPIPIQSVLKSLPRGFVQDFGFVVLAKAREQMLNKNWNLSLELMLVLDKELDSSNSNVTKLSRLISWEILLVQITQVLEDWPKGSVDKVALANACEACLQTTETVLPRTEITEQCVLCLLNLGRWEFLANFEKSSSSLEIISSIALACQELVKNKGNKKLSKNLWDIVLPIFITPPSQSKRGNSNNPVYHDSHLNTLKNEIMAVFSKLRDSTVLTIVISMLTRLHNVLRDETNMELQVEYAILWPAVISNANSYNPKMACEVLAQMVTQALNYYPTNISWLRLLGDINFANGHYNISLKYYLKFLLIHNDYFNIPVRHDDHVFRRMIKCCMALGCQTQAAVLCQFLEEPDYVLAFRILGEQKYCNDAVDAYYHCIWDTNILEYLIHTHNKRGEYQRRKCATQVIGLLELNSNNNEEIQREASNLRKNTFLRALCKQYVFD